jgi:NitT/TauT family transport system substrate-binding protein
MRTSHRLLNRTLLSGLVALGLLAHVPAGAQPTNVRVSTIPVIDAAPLHVAISKGYFAEQGLEVDLTPSVGGAVGLPAVAAGHMHIALSNIVSIILAAKEGLGFQMIASSSASGDAPPNSAGLVSRKGTTFKTGKELEGKRVAVNTRNSINWLVVREWVQLTGGNPERLTFLEVPFPQMMDTVRGGGVDAAFMVDPFLSAGLGNGTTELVGWPYDTIMKRVPIAQYAATKTFIQANPGVIERWVRGYNKGIDWVNQNKGSEEWVKIVSGFTRMTPDQLKNVAVPVWEKTVDAAAVGKIIVVMRKHGLLDGPMDAKDLLYKTATEIVK